MKQTIQLNTIYSADLYTRSRASELRTCIDKEVTEVVLDFEGIGFMSRSFADEVCNIMDDNKDIKALKFSHTELFPTVVGYDQVQKILVRNGYGKNTFNSPVKVNGKVFMDIYEVGRN